MHREDILNSRYGKWAPHVVIGLVFGVVGLLFITASHASTPTASVDAAGGTVSACAASVNDSTANSGQAVSFGNGSCATDPTTLDASGATIPDTNYAIPSGAIFMATTGINTNSGTQAAPVATLNQAMALVPSGGTIVVRGGLYRDWYNSGTTYKVATKTVNIQAYPHEQPWFDGADVKPASSWTNDGAGHWYMDWNTPGFCDGGYYNFAYNAQAGSATNPGSNAGPCTHFDNIGDASHPAAADPQMVFKNGTYVDEVTSLASVDSTHFYYQQDTVNKTGRLYIGFDPASVTTEVSARPVAFITGFANSSVRGIGFKRYANNEFGNNTSAVVRLNGDGSIAENDAFTLNAAGALSIAAHSGLVNHVVLANNGFTPLGSNGHQHSDGSVDGLTIKNSLMSGNNTEYFGLSCSASCGAGGIKLAHMDGFTVKNNIFAFNHGESKGFWCDLACSGGVMIHNVSHDNGGDGLFYEVSDGGIIASNLVYNNTGYGIGVASANTKVYNNTLIDNTGFGGIQVFDDRRSLNFDGWTDVGPDTTNVSFGNNIVVDTKNSNTLLRAAASNTLQTNTNVDQLFSYFDFNAYWRTSSTQNLMRWIPSGAAETAYKSLSSFQTGRGFDTHSSEVSAGSDPFFTNAASHDYTVRSNSVAYHSGGAIPSDVATALGVSTASGQTKGALSWPGN